MGIKSKVDGALKAFEKAVPEAKGKAYQTSSDRSWEEQLDIILDPKRKENYPNIKDRFLKAFALKRLPDRRRALAEDQLAWWKKEIMKQAGKSPGFPHVGGKAVDVSVRQLSVEQRRTLLKAMKEAGIKVLLEYVTATKSDYGVDIGKANVFHCY